MQRPPAASLKVSRSNRLGCFFGSLIFLFSLAPLHAVWSEQALWRSSAIAVIWLLLSSVLLLSWRRMPSGSLRWDGEAWHWSGSAQSIQAVRIQYDFQQCMWIQVRVESGPQFGVWLEAGKAQPEQWRALRRALVWSDEVGSHASQAETHSVQVLS